MSLFYETLLLLSSLQCIFVEKTINMSDNILKIGFNLIRKTIKSDSLEDSLMIYDNLSGEIGDFVPFAITDYPVRLNSITIIFFCTEGYIKFNMGLKNMKIAKNQLFVSLPEQIIQVTEISPDRKSTRLNSSHT